MSSERADSAQPKAPDAESGGAAGSDAVKQVNELIRAARSEWDAHNNAACRRLRNRALAAYSKLTPEQKQGVPQVLRVWLRYRSERYFGPAVGRKKPRR